jgi:AbrB family looped-hinge helix DNA binding protein
METVSVSTKYQIVIPKLVREALGIKPGQKIQVFHYQNRIELIPIKSMQQARGLLKGIDTTVVREPDRL